MFPFNVPGDQIANQRKTSASIEALFAYRMRWKRRRLLVRSLRRRAEITRFSGGDIPQSGVLVFSTMRNEVARVEHWLSHYRALGVTHFLRFCRKFCWSLSVGIAWT